MEVSRKKVRFGFLGSLADAGRTSERKKYTRAKITVSIQISVNEVKGECRYGVLASEASFNQVL